MIRNEFFRYFASSSVDTKAVCGKNKARQKARRHI